MAGQELKATDKVVLKNSRNGAVEKNLANGSTTRISGKLTGAVLKPPQRIEAFLLSLLPHFCYLEY